MPTSSNAPPAQPRPHAAVAYISTLNPRRYIGHCLGCLWHAVQERDTQAEAEQDTVDQHLTTHP